MSALPSARCVQTTRAAHLRVHKNFRAPRRAPVSRVGCSSTGPRTACSLHISMGEQLHTATQEKQTCAICLQTIRKNAVWWHVTECQHYFHYDCWHTYHKHECDRREGDHTRVRCPACRHPQISKAQFMAVMVPLMERALSSGQ